MERRFRFKRQRRPGEDVAGGEPAQTPETEAVSEALPEGDQKDEQPKRKRGFLGGRRAGEVPEVKAAPANRPVRPPAPNLTVVRRERRLLVRDRERRLRDLGGLLLEMYRRDRFREDLLLERCAQAMSVENRIHELDAIVAHRSAPRRSAPGPRCACGAPLLFGARFCASCGRPTALVPAGATCANCGQPLAADAVYCASCGVIVSAGSGLTNAGEETMLHTPLQGESQEER